MSQNPSVQLAENPAASHSDTLAALARMLDYAAPGRFVLAFAKCNTPLQRSKLVDELKTLLEPLNVVLLEVELKEPVEKLLPLLQKKLAGSYLAPLKTASIETPALVHESQPKPALFVYGLEHSIPSSDPHPPILAHLNLARELFRESIPCPLVIWLPDYALTLLARGAPDFWAWRSGVYEFAAEPEIAERGIQQAVYSERSYETSSLPAEAKRERLHTLARLLEDYHELGNGLHEREAQASIMVKMGDIYEDLGEWDEAQRHYEKALDLIRTFNNRSYLATLLHNLALLMQDRGDIAEAHSLYDESLQIVRELGDQLGIAATLHQLGTLAQDRGDIAEARRLYEESLQLKRELGNKMGIASTLHNLGLLAQDGGDLAEAFRLYDESLQISRELGNKRDIATVLHNLGRLMQGRGDLEQARRLYDESLQLKREMGDKEGIAFAIGQRALLEAGEDNLDFASALTQEAEELLESMGSPLAEKARLQREWIESKKVSHEPLGDNLMDKAGQRKRK